MKKLDLIKQIINLTAKNGLRNAIQIVFTAYLKKSLLNLGKAFAFGPVSWLTGLAINWVLDQMLDFLEDWVKYQITVVLVGKDFDKLKDVFKKRDELEKKEVITDVEYEHMDQEIRTAAANAFRVGRVRS